MSESFTPGPWFAGPLQEGEFGEEFVSVGPFDLAERWGGRPDYSPERFGDHYEDGIAYVYGGNHCASANAGLIAAAPDVFEALKALVDASPSLIVKAVRGPGDEMGLEAWTAAITKARDALSKVSAQ